MRQRFYNHDKPTKSKLIKKGQGGGATGWNIMLGRETQVNSERSKGNSWGRGSSSDFQRDISTV